MDGESNLQAATPLIRGLGGVRLQCEGCLMCYCPVIGCAVQYSTGAGCEFLSSGGVAVLCRVVRMLPPEDVCPSQCVCGMQFGQDK